MARGDFFSPAMIEDRTGRLLVDYARWCGGACRVPPVPVEDLVERFLGLRLLWDVVPEPPERTILAKLVPCERRVVLNEAHLDLYQQTPGLERTALAHEVGHWELHLERGAMASTLPLPGVSAHDYPLYRKDPEKMDWDERNAHRFMGCLLMPKAELLAAVRDAPVHCLADLYSLAECFAVTVTALRIRLEILNLAYVDVDGNLHPSRPVAVGQLPLC